MNAKFKQSGINFSKIDIVSDGKVVIEADTPASFVDGLVLNTSYTMGTEKWCSGKDNAESAQVGFEFPQDQFVFNHSMDFLGKNGDNDALTMDSDLGFTMDNFSFGASVSSFMPSVFGGDGGASGMDSYAVKCGYKTGDFELSATVGEPGKSNNLSAGFFHNVSSSTSWGFLFKQGKGDSIKNRDFNLTVGAEFVRDVEPGEMVVISNNGIESIFPFRRQNSKFCIFEHVYFSRPDSIIHGQSVYETRRRIGVELAKESPIDADLVCPVPDSGTPAAIGFSQQSGIPYAMGIIRNQYMGRTFIEPTEQIRNMGVRLKLNVNRALIKGKRIILVDDSVVRGTTSRKIKEMIIDAGAKEVHFRIASPPTAWPCFYGVDTPQREKLIAATMTEEEMRQHLSVNTLKFISLDGLYRATGEKEGRDTKCPQYCDACFSGEYPVLPSDMLEKGFKLKHAEVVDGS